MKSQDQLDSERREDLVRMVQVEAFLLVLLRGRSRKALAREAANEAVRAHNLRNELLRTLIEGRNLAATAAYQTTSARLNDLGITWKVSRGGILRATQDFTLLSAERAANGTMSRWLGGQIDENSNFKMGFELERMASTEAVSGYIRARDEHLASLPDAALKTIFKLWQSAEDKRVCPTCESMEGEIVRADKEFRLGPAPLHTKCRCSYTLFTE